MFIMGKPVLVNQLLSRYIFNDVSLDLLTYKKCRYQNTLQRNHFDENFNSLTNFRFKQVVKLGRNLWKDTTCQKQARHQFGFALCLFRAQIFALEILTEGLLVGFLMFRYQILFMQIPPQGRGGGTGCCINDKQ